MTREDDFIAQLEGYLDEYEGLTPLPDAVRDAVRAELPTTKQIGPVAGLLRNLNMTMHIPPVARYGLVAAAVVAAVLLGVTLFGGGPNVGGEPDVTSTPTAVSSPMPLRDGTLAAGTYVTNPFPAPNDSISFTFAVPDGWEGFSNIGLLSDGTALGFNLVYALYSDPCHGNAEADVAVGPTVDDLAAAFRDQTAYEATAPTDVTLGGYSGKQMVLELPSDVDLAACDNGGFFVWEGGPYSQGPGNRWHLWILDVDGVRVVILANDFPETSAQDQAELQAVVDSIRIQP